MILIRKSQEPKEVVVRKNLPPELGGTYRDMNKVPVAEVLLEDQKHLCAFCMASISNPKTLPHPWKIAHFIPQHLPDHDPANPDHVRESINRGLDWKNMFLACMGNEKSRTKSYCCDKSQGNKIPYLNPTNLAHIKLIKGRIKGPENFELYSDDDTIDRDIQSTFGLNNEFLPSNRACALRAFREHIKKIRAERSRYQEIYDEWKWEIFDKKRKSFSGVVAIKFGLMD